MRALYYLLSFIFVLCELTLADNNDGHQGDSKSCLGKQQSPIDIISTCQDSKTTTVKSALKLEYQKYSEPIPTVNLVLTNNGHTAKLSYKKSADGVLDKAPKVSGSAVTGQFQFTQLHFHWHLEKDNEGTEHAIDGKRHALELHLVHWNTKYPNMAKALENPDGLLVLGILYDVMNDDCPLLKPITDQLEAVINAGQDIDLKSDIKLGDFLGKESNSFYKYFGGLTTPPCSEIVNWIVFTSLRPIGQTQLKKFRSLLGEDKKPFSNVRELQTLNGRKIEVTDASSCKSDKVVFY